MDICKNCEGKQWSPLDRSYLKLFGICWGCDKINWEIKQLPLEGFELRERQALENVKG